MSARRRVAVVDEEIAVHLRHMRAAHAQAPAARRVDQLPGAVAGRVLEGRSAGAAFDGLVGFPVLGHIAHGRFDLGWIAGGAFVRRLGEDVVQRQAAMAVGEAHAGVIENVKLPGAIHGAGLDEEVFRLAAMRAGIHAQRAANRAGNAPVEGEPGDPGRRRCLCQAQIGDCRAGADAGAAKRCDFVEPAREPDHHARHAAVADEQVRAHAHHHHRHVSGAVRQEISEVVLVRRREEELRRPARPEPCQFAEQDIRQEPAAKVRRGGPQARCQVGKHELHPMGERVAKSPLTPTLEGRGSRLRPLS